MTEWSESAPPATKTASGRDLVTSVAEGPREIVASGTPRLDQVLAHAARYATESSSNGPGAMMLTVVAICVMTVTTIAGMPLLGVGLIAAVLLVSAGGFLSVGWREARAQPRRIAEERRRAGNDARLRASGRFEAMVPEGHPEWLTTFRSIHQIINDDAAIPIAEDMAFRLRDLCTAFEKAIADAGRSDTGIIRARATEATIAIVKSARAQYDDIDNAIRRRDEARAPQVTRNFAQTARAIAGVASAPAALPPPSASAALQRLIGLAEDALHVDPDLTDTNGARIDTLIREHLPRLLETHADAARSSASDLAAVDAQLAIGVEKVRASVERALSADAQARFDRLRTEVAFLTMRGEG